ncbi:hypothetical protein [Paenibacillus macquariensis]|uniref:XkdX family protein n=1 Tax=Paenibacillus macquariensis TaxID=948756 RepID=A0ABY1K6Z4_9BACL|nr:hypothetical protein [Paenibacillus macquariensis]MEC0092513.1 hypothetical protein [Paenibacillus macquariensis]SIR35198.1 hypothetical protein SAMN05421578_111153 [Paenibacillus macquariensis]
MGAKYNLFLRNWINNIATVEQIKLAVMKEFITEEESAKIMATDRNPL